MNDLGKQIFILLMSLIWIWNIYHFGGALHIAIITGIFIWLGWNIKGVLDDILKELKK